MKRACFILFGLCCPWWIVAQQRDNPETLIAEMMERYIESGQEDVDYTDLEEQLAHYMQHPLNINKASKEELEALFFLDERDVAAIMAHRTQFGELISIFELQTIDALNEQTVYYLSYFVCVDEELLADRSTLRDMLRKGRSELTFLHDNGLQQRKGYMPLPAGDTRQNYLGSPYRYVLRYRFSYSNRLSFGYSGEKDRGEPFFSSPAKYGFDFNSFHAFYRKSSGLLRVVALGDYQVNFGQGLTFGSGIGTRKSAYVLNVKRSYEPLRPYRSLNENEFMRGIACGFQKRRLGFTVFLSHKYISTNYSDADTLSAEEAAFSSIQLSGLHRTPNEIAGRLNVLQTVCGGHLEWKQERWQLGFTAVQTVYDHYFAHGDQPYQLYAFSGNKLGNVGLDYSFSVFNATVFGEAARSSNNAFAVTSGLSVPLDDKLDLVLLYRSLAKDYHVTFNNPFAENSDGRDEEGFYAGISYRPARRWTINAYHDSYRSLWLRYLTDGISHGNDRLLELQFNPSRTTQVYLRWRAEEKWKNQPGNEARSDYMAAVSKNTWRLHAQYRISEACGARSRAELTQYYDPLNGYRNGALIFQEVSYNKPLARFGFSARLSLFSVDDYNARIYATAPDVLYQYPLLLYQNSGLQYYLLVDWNLSRRVELWFRYMRTTYSNVTHTGSGLEEVAGNTLDELRLQCRWRL